MPWDYVPLERVDVRDALLVVGGPGLGEVGGVAATVLVEALDMRPVGGFHADEMPPVGVVRRGRFLPPLQVWASDVRCGPDGACDRLLVLRADFRPPLDAFVPIALGVAQWARDAGVKLVVALDGYPSDAPQGEHDVLAAVTDAAQDVALRLRAEPLRENVCMGLNAAFLLGATRVGLPAVALYATVRDGHAVHGAADALDVVRPLVPNLPLPVERLEERARKVEERLQQEQHQQARQRERLREVVDVGYA